MSTGIEATGSVTKPPTLPKYGRRYISASIIRRYGLGLCFVAVALLLTLLVRSLFAHPFYFLFFPAVMGAAWLGGSGPGLFAVLLSTTAIAFFLEPPIYSLAVNSTDLTYFCAFVVCALAASWVSSLEKTREQSLLSARDRLEARVAENTAELHRSKTELLETDRGLRLLTEVMPRRIWRGVFENSSGDPAAPLNEVLAQIVEFAVLLVKCDSCFIYVLEDDELILSASKNPHPEAVNRLKLKLGQGITGWVAKHRQPVAVAKNAADDPRFQIFNELPEDRFEALLSVPVLSRGQLVGVINLQNRTPYEYNEREIRLLSMIGFLVGGEIEMARLEAERSEISQKLSERKIIERAKGILQQDFEISEEGAYLMLQKESRKRRKTMKEFAQSIILNHELRHARDKA